MELYRFIKSRFPNIEIQASGGIANFDDLKELQAEGMAGAIVGKALYENRISLHAALTC